MRGIWTFFVLTLLVGCGQKQEQNAEQEYAARMAEQHKTDQPTATAATQTQPSAPIRSQIVSYTTVGGKEIHGYLAYPADAEGGLPAVLVLHEWWGLNDNIKSMADQLAGQGYVALAADLYRGETAATPAAAKALLERTLADRSAITANLRAAPAYLRDQVKATRIATLGWCLGGGMSLQTALLLPDQVDATVIYYGQLTHDAGGLLKLNMPILGFFGGRDPSILTDSVRAFEQALKAQGKSPEIYIYEDADHAFANPSGQNYKADAAADAWQKTLAFLEKHLKS